MRKNIIPDVVCDQEIAIVARGASVQEAARLMADRKVSSVLVIEGSKLLGIFTVRDIARRVVAAALDPESTSVEAVMSEDPDTVVPDEIPIRALRLMQQGGYRHLPVVQGDKVVGIVSRRDFFGEEEASLDQETYLWEHIR